MQTGFIYVLQVGEDAFVKIGYASNARNVDKRLVGLQTGNPEQLHLRVAFPGTRRDEAALHRRFANDRCDGGGHEWFRLTEDIEQLIAAKEQEHADLQPPLHNGERYRALRALYMRWGWRPIHWKKRDASRIPRLLTASDVHRAIEICDTDPDVIQKMIGALSNGATMVPDEERGEWPILFLDAYIGVQPDPLDPDALRQFWRVYHYWPEEWNFIYKKGRRRSPEWTQLMEAIAARLPEKILDAPLFGTSSEAALS